MSTGRQPSQGSHCFGTRNIQCYSPVSAIRKWQDYLLKFSLDLAQHKALYRGQPAMGVPLDESLNQQTQETLFKVCHTLPSPPHDDTRILQHTSRTMRLVVKEAICIRAEAESLHFNRDGDYNIPDCWIATYKKLRYGADTGCIHPITS